MTTGLSESRAKPSFLVPLGDDEWRAGSVLRLEALKRQLASPPLTLSAPELAALFEIDRVRIVAERPDGMQDYPDMAVRVRGAFGRVLAALGPPIIHRRDPATRPRAWDVVFESMALPGAAVALGKPLVVHAGFEDKRLVASVGLMGMSGFWLRDASAALLGALEGGIALWEDGRMKVPLVCLEAKHERASGFMPPGYRMREARLRFRTPLRLRSGDAPVTRGASFLIAVANRVARVAPWQLARLAIDWNAVHTSARTIEADLSGLLPYRWSRGSRRAQKRLPLLGILGTLALRGDLDMWAPLLQIAEAVNCGAHAALGLGRFDLALLP